MSIFKLMPLLFMAYSSICSVTTRFDEAGNFEGFRFRESEQIQPLHKYYLSVSNVKYSEKAKALQMTSRYFIDDLEDVLNERLDTKMSLGNQDGLAELKPILHRYFLKRIFLKVDGAQTDPTVLGAEYDADQIIIYIEFPTTKQPKTVEVSNKALFELFTEQKNLAHFKIGDSRKSILNSKDTPIDRVKF